MPRSSKPSTIVAILAAIFVVSWFTVSVAQRPSEGCKQECEDQETFCLEGCARHSNPIECESECRNVAWDCKSRC